MGRPCKICVHPKREEIETKIIDEVPYRMISEEYGMGIASVSRHKDHMTERIAKATHAKDVVAGGSLLERLETLEADARRIADKAERDSRLSIALQANREQQRIIELLLKVAGELQDQQTVNVVVSSEWVQLRSIIFRVLENYPEARRALALELKRVQTGDYIDGQVREITDG